MTVVHLAAFTWKAAVPGDDLTRLEEALRALATSPSGVVESYDVGPDSGVDMANADFGVVARFTDATAFLAYRDHPATGRSTRSSSCPTWRRGASCS